MRATVEERVSSIEATLPFLATKEDLGRLERKIDALETRLVKWMVGLQLGGIVALAAVGGAVVAVLKYLE